MLTTGQGRGKGMNTVLEGMRIIDLTQWLFCPVAAAHLADMGADVIHVESPWGGDPARGVLSTRALPLSDWNSYFDTNNRNKRSLAIDLRAKQGREVIYKLVEKSDVFLSSLTRPSLQRLGLDYSTLSRINSRIIYAHGSGYGRYGPDKDRDCYDGIGAARAGYMSVLGEPGQPPVHSGMATGDAAAALTLAWGIITALYYRERTGHGQEVDVSLFGSQIMFESFSLLEYLGTGSDFFEGQRSRKEAPNCLSNIYHAKDKWMYLCMPESELFWANFCRGLGIDYLEHDPRFDTSEKRRENSPILIPILDEIFATKTASEWLERWQDFGLMASTIDTFAELDTDPQARENEFIVEVEHPIHGKVSMIGFPVQLSRTPGKVRSTGPELGQHNEEILVDLLGYSWDEITQLKDLKVIL